MLRNTAQQANFCDLLFLWNKLNVNNIVMFMVVNKCMYVHVLHKIIAVYVNLWQFGRIC